MLLFAIATAIVIVIVLLATASTATSINNSEFLTSPISGSEPDLNLKWWKKFPFSTYHNCYDYAFNNIKHKRRSRSQPGVITGGSQHTGKYTCDILDKRLNKDHPDIQPTTFEKQCPAGAYKIALMVDPGIPIFRDSDYHFMRQDSNELWSHKPGGDYPVNTDGDGNLIYAPHEAERDLGFYNYKKMCGYYCIGEDSKDRFVD